MRQDFPHVLICFIGSLWLIALSILSVNCYHVQNKMVDVYLDKFNEELRQFRHLGANLAWNMSIEMSQDTLDKNEQFTIERNIWTNAWCSRLMEIHHNPFSIPWDLEQQRQLYLICRGPRFSSYQLSNILAILSTMQKLYNKEICIDGSCMRMEPDLNRIMESSRDEKMLKNVWSQWHKQAGTDVKPIYVSLVKMLNEGARQAGHVDMGDCWREETEVKNLRQVAGKLYSDVKYLYQLLHSFVRFKLEKFYKMNMNFGAIPTHLLGNMYAQNWASLLDIVWEDDENPGHDEAKSNPLVKSLLPKNATVLDMVKAAEDFFVSMGMPKLSKAFWENSYFEDKKSTDGDSSKARNCHGSAANMFGMKGPDYRMMMCAKVNDEDQIVLQHEVGHLMYFSAYENLPTIFQDGANGAFHESVGDSVTYDLKTPRSSNDKKSDDIKSLLRTGLAKIPQVGYGLVMDNWRWNVFENENGVKDWNNDWWRLSHEFLGIKVPEGYDLTDESLLDAAGKFHIIDNIPYIRYFLASFLQVQFYESMCKVAGYEDMHSCKIRGSKKAGSLLWNMMSKGTSKHWSEILEEMTGVREIESDAFLKYFEPLKIWLEGQVKRNNLTIGW